MPAAAAGTRPRSHRRGSSRANLAYDLGHRGEDMPAWVSDNDEYIAAYEDGVSDRDFTGGQDTGARPGRADRTDSRRATSDESDDPLADVVPIDAAPSRKRSTPVDSPPATPVASNTRSGAGPFTRTGDTVISAGDSVGSAILGLIAYAVLINVINGTFRQWIAAKFTNGGGTLP